MKNILFFSNNSNKFNEARKLLLNKKIKLMSPLDFNIITEPKENGLSFSENAKIKSSFGYKKIKIPCFADDSGICIEALNWKPNIYSKRFIDSFDNKTDCLQHIIKKVKKSGKNKAFFETSICYTIKENYHIVFKGRVNGTISDDILGNKGFGYDPIFIPNGFRKTFGQLKTNEKNLFSHRSIAINKFLNFLFN